MSTHTEANPETHPRPSKRRHPGSGRGEARRRPKGRQVDPEALDEVRALLGDRPRDRDLLIEHLHLIQDSRAASPRPILAALAHEMRLPMAEVYEVATFYAHFDVLAEGEAPPPPITVRVCDSLSCELAGARALLESLPPRPRRGRARGSRPLHGPMRHRPGGRGRASPPRPRRRAGDPCGHRRRRLPSRHPEYRALDAYEHEGGYALLRACLRGEYTFEDVAAKLDAAGLRGLGGADSPPGASGASCAATKARG